MRLAMIVIAATSILGVLGCAASPPPPRSPIASSSTCEVARDRAAILAMAGEFDVSFAFEETDVLADGYQQHPAYHTDAREVVAVVESSEHKVVLQHVLVLEGVGAAQPLKHWRQDWTFEDGELVEFQGHRTWARRALSPADVACTWSQAVFEVDDGPRYQSIGRWVHDGDRSTWTSAETWRPLPRREYTKRSDYDVLLGTNRHIVTKDGWTHEQDNVKLVLADGRRLVRERGENRYVRARFPEAEVAHAYLRATSSFWAAVRAEWAVQMRAPRFTVVRTIDDRPLYELLLPLAGADAAGQQVHQLIARFVQPATVSAAR